MLSTKFKFAIPLLVWLCSSDTFAEFALPNVAPGTQYRLAFVTSGIRDATSSNIDDYNLFVTQQANMNPLLSSLGTTWKAIGTTEMVDARDNTGTNPSSTGVPIFLLDGSLLAADNDYLWTWGLLRPLSLNQFGIEALGPRSQGRVFTGTLPNGVANMVGYLGYQTTGPGSGIDFGGYHSITYPGAWIAAGPFAPAASPLPFYAMSDVITAVPEPSSLLGAVSLGVGGLLYRRKRRRKTNS